MNARPLLILSLLVTAACTSLDESPAIKETRLRHFSLEAGMAYDGTRAQMDGRTSLAWSPSDQILIHDGTDVRVFTSTNTSASSSTTFEGMAEEDASSFAALYPATKANSIAMKGGFATFSVSIPAIQTAIEDSFDPDAHAAYACLGADGSLHFHHIGAMIRFTAPQGDWSSVSISGGNGENIAGRGSVTIGIDTGRPDGSFGNSGFSISEGSEEVSLSGQMHGGREYIICVAPVELENGMSFTFTDPDGNSYSARMNKKASLQAGRILNAGTPAILKSGNYAIYGESQLASLSSALTSMGVPSQYSGTISLVGMLFFRNTTQPVQAVDFTYTSVDPFGEPAILSARMYVRKAIWNGTGSLKGTVLACHATVAGAHEGPTETPEIHGLLGWADYAVVEPDYYGFGVTSSKMQGYLQKETTARQCLDALVAARKILEDKNITYGSKCFNLGYSQGGHAAIGNLWYLATKGGYDDIKFTKTIAGAGPYDLDETYKWMMGQTTCAGTFSIPLCVISMNEYGRLGLSYSRIFKGSLLSNYRDWVMSGNLTLSQLTAKISNRPSDLLVAGIVNGTLSEAKALAAEFAKNSLTSGWDPSESGPIVLFHSTQDDIVPTLNSELLNTFLKEAGANVTLSTSASGGHTNAAYSYAITMLQNLN